MQYVGVHGKRAGLFQGGECRKGKARRAQGLGFQVVG